MSKIDFRFQDEQGTNLNRYIATNVENGERMTLDLLRGAIISAIGTPLNAEKLNALIEGINESYRIEIDSGNGKPSDVLVIGGVFLKKLEEEGN